MKASLILLLLSTIILSCNKVSVVTPAFDVTTAKTTYKIGDTVKFNFSGNTDNLTFYSGEAGKSYDNRSRTNIESSSPIVSFTSNVQTGNQTNNLTVLASANFNGQFDANSIKAASWTDITSRGKLATSATNVASGDINLTDLKTSGKSVYVAFRYTSTTNTTTSISRSWTINAFQFRNTFPDGSQYIIASDVPTGGFSAVSVQNDALKWTIGTTTMTFPAGTIGAADEDWAISRAFTFDQSAPDVGVALKNVSSSLATSYNYNYTKAGTYKATFVASNRVAGNADELVKTITITVTL